MIVEEGVFSGFDGKELAFQTWPKDSAKALIVAVHGLGEHSDAYQFLAQGLETLPVQLFMADLRGHGRSYGKRGLGTIDDFVKDTWGFIQFVQNKMNRGPAKLPLFMLGHSMGGLVATKLLIRHGDLNPMGLILSSPLFGLSLEVPWLKLKSAHFLAQWMPEMTLYNEIKYDHLTRDKHVVDRYKQDPLRHDRISPSLFLSMLDNFEYCLKQGDKINVPVLMQQAGQDRIVSVEAASRVFESFKSVDKTRWVYEACYHEIYNDIERDKVFSDMRHWLEPRLRSL